MDSVVAKMNCYYVQTQDNGRGLQHKVYLGVDLDNGGGSQDFAAGIANGECWMNISTGRPAMGFFKPDKKYFITFTEAPD